MAAGAFPHQGEGGEDEIGGHYGGVGDNHGEDGQHLRRRLTQALLLLLPANSVAMQAPWPAELGSAGQA